MQKIIKHIFSEKYFPPFITVVLLLFSSIAITGLIAGELYTIKKASVTMRTSPATNSQAVETIESGSEVIIIREESGWYQVRHDGTTEGWLPIWLLESDVLESDQNLAAHILLSTPIYAEQSLDSEELLRIDAGEYLFVNYESNGWVQVVYDGQYGYIPTNSVNLIPREDVPLIEPEEEIDEEETDLEAELAADENIVIIRQANQGFLSEPSLYGDIIYTPAYNQRFAYLETYMDENGFEYYLVEDEDGIRGYLESRITARLSDYHDHVGRTNPGSISNAVIMIDAGHGGEDAGAISFDNSVYEKNVTLLSAQLLQEKLEDLGATVIMSRTDDSYVELDERTALSNENDVDAFLSLHYDASLDPSWHGTTTYYFHEEDYDLADAVNQQIAQLELPNNNVVFGNYYVLRENNRPGLLLELGYMSNSFDLEFIQSEAYIDQVTDAITLGLASYFNQ